METQITLSANNILDQLKKIDPKINEKIVKNFLILSQKDNILDKITDKQSLLNALLMSASIINMPLVHWYAYIIPYNGKAQYQIWYKGLIQLCIRTWLFEQIDAIIIKKGQLLWNNPIEWYKFDFSIESEETIWYFAFFVLKNWFKANFFMTKKEAEIHAKKYSSTYKKGNGVWVEEFDKMGIKTTLKLLLSKYAPLDIWSEILEVINVDQWSIKNINKDWTIEVDYIDNEKDQEQNKIPLKTKEQEQEISELSNQLFQKDFKSKNIFFENFEKFFKRKKYMFNCVDAKIIISKLKSEIEKKQNLEKNNPNSNLINPEDIKFENDKIENKKEDLKNLENIKNEYINIENNKKDEEKPGEILIENKNPIENSQEEKTIENPPKKSILDFD